MFRRRILFTGAVVDAIREADAVAVNSFPFDNPEEVSALVRALGEAKGHVVDRLNAAALRHLLSDRSAFEIVETNRRERGRSAELVAVSAAVYAPWML